jgi:hypothetical protein
MNFHKNSLSIRRWPPWQAIMHAPIGLNWHEMYHAALHQYLGLLSVVCHVFDSLPSLDGGVAGTPEQAY